MIDFGTCTKPLRASRLPDLVLCSWRAVAKELNIIDSESGKAADTGSAVHLAVAAFHLRKGDPVAEMKKAAAAFPLADMDAAERIFRRYLEDPRNRNAEVVATEFQVEVTIDLKYIDGEPIVIQGTLDQVRRVGNTWEVWDLKTGDRDAAYMQNVYALQMAAYTLAARKKFPAAVAGGYIRTKGYFTRGCVLPSPHGVFIPACIPDPDKLLDAVRWAVCAIRSGYVVASPGSHCEYCPFASSEFCLPRLSDFLSQ